MYQSESGKWVPIFKGDDKRLAIMSIGFLLNNRDDPIIWRGPKKTSMIRQFINDIEWGDLDYLIVDTPPGTSDEHITIMECMNEITGKCDGAIIVTTPQEVSLEDVRKEITFCKKTKIAILGIIENMNGFTCPNCAECTPIFSSDGEFMIYFKLSGAQTNKQYRYEPNPYQKCVNVYIRSGANFEYTLKLVYDISKQIFAQLAPYLM